MKKAACLLSCACICFGQNVVLVGGGMEDPSIINQFLGLAGAPKQQIICTITCAGEDPEDSATYYHDTFTSFGAQEVYWVPVTVNNTQYNKDPAVLDHVKKCGGVFFGGGDQSRLLTCLYDNYTSASPLLQLLYSMNRAGVVIGGTSAGEVILSGRNMLTGGNSWNALVYGTFPTAPYQPGPLPDDVTFYRPGGIGLFPDSLGALDMHVGILGRQARLIRLMLDNFATTRQPLGFGVGQDTAFFLSDVQTKSPRGTVVGQDGVYIINVSQAVVSSSKGLWRVDHVLASFLSAGDSYDFAQQNITIEASKTLVTPGSETLPNPGTSSDIWSSPYNPTNRPHEFTKLCRRLFDAPQKSAQGITYEKTPGYTVVVSKVANSAGYRSDSSDSIASFLNVDISIFAS